MMICRSRKAFGGFFLAGLLLSGGCETIPPPLVTPGGWYQQPAPDVFVTVKQSLTLVNIRPDPSTEQKPVATVRGGDRLGLLAEHENWLNVTVTDAVGRQLNGWVYKFLIDGYEQPKGSVQGAPAPRALPRDAEPDTATDNKVRQSAPPPPKTLPKSEKISPL